MSKNMNEMVCEKTCDERREFILSRLDLIVDNFEKGIETIQKNNDYLTQIIDKLEQETDQNSRKVMTINERVEHQSKFMGTIDSKINWIIGLGASIFIALILSVFRYMLNK